MPYGYPTGAQLIEQIIGVSDRRVMAGGNWAHLNLSRDSARSHEFGNFNLQLDEFCQTVKKFRPINIDSFLRDNPSLENLGRQLITYLIMTAEHNNNGSIAKYDNTPDVALKGWYPILFEALVSRCDAPEKLHELHGLKIITFNYDVSLEYFLAQALLGNERTRPYAKEIFESIPIIHIFGKVGTVAISEGSLRYSYGRARQLNGYVDDCVNPDAWQITQGGNLHVAIETKQKHAEVIRDAALAKKFILDAHQVLCMGFDFHPDNCDLIDIEESYWRTHPSAHAAVVRPIANTRFRRGFRGV